MISKRSVLEMVDGTLIIEALGFMPLNPSVELIFSLKEPPLRLSPLTDILHIHFL